MSARAWISFAAVSTLWGMPYLSIKVAVDDGVPPLVLAWVRVVLGGCVLLGLAWRAGTLGSLAGRGRWLIVFGVAEVTIPFPLIAFGAPSSCVRFAPSVRRPTTKHARRRNKSRAPPRCPRFVNDRPGGVVS